MLEYIVHMQLVMQRGLESDMYGLFREAKYRHLHIAEHIRWDCNTSEHRGMVSWY